MIKLMITRDRVEIELSPGISKHAKIMNGLRDLICAVRHTFTEISPESDPFLPAQLFGVEEEWHPPAPTPTHELVGCDGKGGFIFSKKYPIEYLQSRAGSKAVIESTAGGPPTGTLATGFFINHGMPDEPFDGIHIDNFTEIKPTSDDEEGDTP